MRVAVVLAVTTLMAVGCAGRGSSESSGGGGGGAGAVAGTGGTGGTANAGSSGAGGGAGVTGDPDAGRAFDAGTSVHSGAADGGTPDAARADGSGGVSAACNGAFLCDDFESYTGKPAGDWTVTLGTMSGSTLLVDSSKAYSGTKALHINAGGRDDAYVKTKKGLPTATNELFGRMMLFLKAPWPGNHIRMMLMGSDKANSGYAFTTPGAEFRLESLTDFWGAGTLPVAPNTDKWLCIEWQYSAPVGRAVTAHLWINGKEVAPAPNGWPRVDLLWMWIGFTTATDSSKIEMWVDDVALGDKRVGCP